MRGSTLSILYLAVVLSLAWPGYGRSQTDTSDAPLREALEAWRGFAQTEVILGQPRRLEGVTIIPVATVGMGFGQRQEPSDRRALVGAGGVLSPVGVLVVSPRGVQLLPISKGFLEQALGAITPVLLHLVRAARPAAEGKGAARLTPPDLLAALYAMLPRGGLKFGLFPWPFPLILLFVAGWLALALVVGVFLPQRLTAIASTLREQPFRATLTGVLSYGAVGVLALVFTVSIIGLPLTLVVLALAWALHLLGMVSIAWLIGHTSAVALRQARPGVVRAVLGGGLVLGIIRLIPLVGWLVWLVLGLGGFGAVLLTQVRRERQGV
jgi:uncharacterized spore protein YtfJ